MIESVPGKGRSDGRGIITMTGTPSRGDVISIPSGDLSDIRPVSGTMSSGESPRSREERGARTHSNRRSPHRSALIGPRTRASVMKIVDKFLHHAVDGLRRRDISAKVVRRIRSLPLNARHGDVVCFTLCVRIGKSSRSRLGA